MLSTDPGGHAVTEQLSQSRLQEMASAIGRPQPPSPRPGLVRRWEIDALTGRPVCQWEIEPQSPEARS
jgi:hypothetical protein